jgi:iron complex transport system substrate-binding protein
MIIHLGAVDDLIGVTDICEFENRIDALASDGKIYRVSAFNSFNFEKIVSLEPTHIIGVDSVPMEDKIYFEKLVGKQKLVWLIHPKNFDEIYDQIEKISLLVNKENEGKRIVENMKNKMKHMRSAVANIDENLKPKAVVEIYYPPFVTAGKNTFISDILIKSGARLALNINENWPTPSIEEILTSEPDLIVKTSHQNGDGIDKYFAKDKIKIFVPKNADIFLQPGVESVSAAYELYDFIRLNFPNAPFPKLKYD